MWLGLSASLEGDVAAMHVCMALILSMEVHASISSLLLCIQGLLLHLYSHNKIFVFLWLLDFLLYHFGVLVLFSYVGFSPFFLVSRCIQ